MSYLMNLQYSAFYNNSIEPTASVINNTVAELNNLGDYIFIPSMITGQNIDLLAGKVNPVNNISFLTIDKQVQIACMNDRIDVTINGKEKDQSKSIEEHIMFARKALTLIMDKNHIYSNRLAININLLSNTFDGSIQETNLGRQLCDTLEFYNGKPIEEWSSRVNLRKAIQMDTSELLNVITEISKVLDNSTGKKRFLCHLDINTIFENAGYRFSSKNLKQFDCEVLKIIKELKTNFEEVNNDQ